MVHDVPPTAHTRAPGNVEASPAPTAAHPPTAPTPSPIAVVREEDTGSLASAFTRGWRAFKGVAPVPLDDRMRPTVRAPRSALVDAARDDGGKPAFPWRRILQWTVPVLILAWFIASRFGSVKTVLPLFFLWPLLTMVSAAIARRGGHVSLAVRERMAHASMLRAGRCAACGFALRDLQVHTDNCVVCPECAAAWNRDRWRVTAPNASTLAARGVDCVVTRHVAQQVDDRGAILSDVMRWRPRWFKDAQARAQASPGDSRMNAFLAQGRVEMRRTLIRMLVERVSIAALIMAGVILLVPEPDARVYLSVMGVAALLIMIVVTTYKAQFRVDLRSVALRNALCPECGELLDMAPTRQFDGCIQCPTCACAWKVDDAGAPVARDRKTAILAPPAAAAHPTSASPNAAP